MKADTRRKIIAPSAAELDLARSAFRTVIDDWSGDNPRGRELLTIVDGELARLRATR